MGYRLTASSATDVAIQVAANRTSGTLGGTAYLQVWDTSTSPAKVVDSPTISPSGSINENGVAVRSSGGGFNLDITWNPSGSATGSAAGSYNSTSLSCGVPVSIDGGGKPRHKKGKGVLHPAPRRKAAPKPAAKGKASTAARKPSATRKTATARKRATARR